MRSYYSAQQLCMYQTDRQRETERQMNGQTDSNNGWMDDKQKKTDRQVNGTDSNNERMNRQTDMNADRLTDEWTTDRQMAMDTQADRIRQSLRGDCKQGAEKFREVVLTGSGVRLVARACDLGCQLHLVTRLALWSAVSPKSDHAPSKAGQVTHLMLKEAPFPFRNVSETAARPPDQTRLNGLRTEKKNVERNETRIKANDSV